MANGAWNFDYFLTQFLPGNNIYKIYIVVQKSLQMVWSKFPAYLCAASETARCTAYGRASTKTESIPEYPLE